MHLMAWYTGTCAHPRVQAYGPASKISIAEKHESCAHKLSNYLVTAMRGGASFLGPVFQIYVTSLTAGKIIHLLNINPRARV